MALFANALTGLDWLAASSTQVAEFTFIDPTFRRLFQFNPPWFKNLNSHLGQPLFARTFAASERFWLSLKFVTGVVIGIVAGYVNRFRH